MKCWYCGNENRILVTGDGPDYHQCLNCSATTTELPHAHPPVLCAATEVVPGVTTSNGRKVRTFSLRKRRRLAQPEDKSHKQKEA